MSAFGTSRHFAALQNLSAIGLIVLQKSFGTAGQKFSWLYMRFWNKYVRDLIPQR